LGSGTRWPEIFNEHNKEAAKRNQHRPLMPIVNENLIYVGQTIVLPPRKINPPPGTGVKAEGGKSALPLDLKVTYSIGHDTPPILYVRPYVDFTIKTELSGKISIETISDNMRQHGFELLLSKDPIQAKQKLYKAYDPALSALMAKPEMVFESATGTVKIKAPIATEANLGPFTVKVQGDPNHMSGTIKPQTLNGTLEVRGVKYKFSADIELKAEVIMHPRPKGVNESPVRVNSVEDVKAGPETTPVALSKTPLSTREIIAAVIVSLVASALPALRMTAIRPGATPSIMYFNHSIDPKLHESPDA
jgi:hypothetical protein